MAVVVVVVIGIVSKKYFMSRLKFKSLHESFPLYKRHLSPSENVTIFPAPPSFTSTLILLQQAKATRRTHITDPKTEGLWKQKVGEAFFQRHLDFDNFLWSGWVTLLKLQCLTTKDGNSQHW